MTNDNCVRNIYFDTEFTGLNKNTDLISIGCVDDNGSSFYAEITDYDIKKIEGNDWLKKNVIDNLLHPTLNLSGSHWEISGTKSTVSAELKTWLQYISRPYEKIQFISDVSHYDFVLLIDLLSDGKSAFDIPSWISPSCIDINDFIAYKLTPSCMNTMLNVTYHVQEAFDISREDILSIYGNIKTIPDKYRNKKHNSIYDAYVIKNIWNNYICAM